MPETLTPDTLRRLVLQYEGVHFGAQAFAHASAWEARERYIEALEKVYDAAWAYWLEGPRGEDFESVRLAMAALRSEEAQT